MAMKKGTPSARQARWQGKGSESAGEEPKIKAGVWGQLEPLDRVARDKMSRWGDTLTSFVPPEMAGRFEAAYDALRVYVEVNDVVKVNEVAGQLMRAWDVLEQTALAAGHKPLPEHAYAIDLGDGEGVVCIAMHGAHDLRKAHPDWVVYSFEDAARVLRTSWTEAFLKEAYNAFPNAKVVSITKDGAKQDLNWDIGDEIPW